jgi:hypothetical protein
MARCECLHVQEHGRSTLPPPPHPTSPPAVASPQLPSTTPLAHQTSQDCSHPGNGCFMPQADEQLLDFGNSPTPSSMTTPCASQESHQDKVCDATTRKLSFREVLLSPPPSPSSCSLPESRKDSLSLEAAPQPKLRSILVVPDRANQEPSA